MFGKKEKSLLEHLREENRLLRAQLTEQGNLRRQWENLLRYAGKEQPPQPSREEGDGIEA